MRSSKRLQMRWLLLWLCVIWQVSSITMGKELHISDHWSLIGQWLRWHALYMTIYWLSTLSSSTSGQGLYHYSSCYSSMIATSSNPPSCSLCTVSGALYLSEHGMNRLQITSSKPLEKPVVTVRKRLIILFYVLTLISSRQMYIPISIRYIDLPLMVFFQV